MAKHERISKSIFSGENATSAVPTGANSKPIDNAQTLPPNCTDVCIFFKLTGSGRGIVKAQVFVLDAYDGAVWRDEPGLTEESIAEYSDDTYPCLIANPWLYKAICPVVTVTSGAANGVRTDMIIQFL